MRNFIPVEIGQQLYYEYLTGMVIPVTVTRLQNVYQLSDETVDKYKLVNSTMWRASDDESITAISENAVTEENPYGYITLPDDVLNDAEHVNQFVDIDELIGHSIRVGDELFLTLQEAIDCAYSLNKRRAKRAHKKLQARRKHTANWINSQHERAGTGLICQVVTTHKPIYRVVGKKVCKRK